MFGSRISTYDLSASAKARHYFGVFCLIGCDFWVSNCREPWLGASWLSGTEVCHWSRSLQTSSNKKVNWWLTADVRAAQDWILNSIEYYCIGWLPYFNDIGWILSILDGHGASLNWLESSGCLPSYPPGPRPLKDLRIPRIPMLSASAQGPRMALARAWCGLWMFVVWLSMNSYPQQDYTCQLSILLSIWFPVCSCSTRSWQGQWGWQVMVKPCPCSFELAVASCAKGSSMLFKRWRPWCVRSTGPRLPQCIVFRCNLEFIWANKLWDAWYKFLESNYRVRYIGSYNLDQFSTYRICTAS